VFSKGASVYTVGIKIAIYFIRIKSGGVTVRNADVCIVGGGWSGLVACKYMLQEGLSAVVLEATDHIGGVWHYREDERDRGGVMKSTRTTSSKTVTEMSDFPMPDSFSHFPRHDEILDYLKRYCDHFHLREHIKLNVRVKSVERDSDRWVTEDEQGNRYVSSKLIVCSGVHQFPNKLYEKDERFVAFSGDYIHSAAYKKLTTDYEDKTVLIFGGGETASDIAVEISHVAKKVYLSIPHGQWFVNRYLPFGSMKEPFPLDYYTSRLRRFFDPTTRPHFGEYVVKGIGGFCGHGIEEWRSPAPYWGQFFNKNADVLRLIALGSVLPKPNVQHCENNLVRFVDGSQAGIDEIIFCTGYKTIFPFFKSPRYRKPLNHQFKLVFDVDEPSLAFIGFARPVVGSIPGLAEMQSIYAGKVFSNKVALPSRKKMMEAVECDKSRQHECYAKTSERITGLVNFVLYADELAKLAGVYPDNKKLFFKSPRKWWIAISSPYNNCQFLLNEEKYHEEIFRRFKTYTHPKLPRLSDYIFILMVNVFPKLFLGEKREGVYRWIVNLARLPLWVIFSPVLVYRMLRYPDK
jgi:dimethylaniline monooxygenase (N-oxide forming)